MRAALMVLAMLAASSPVMANADAVIDQSSLPPNYTGGLGLITTLGPTGLFQNATSGILPKNAFSVESCMAFKENNSDHFQSNGVLLTYGVTDWLEISGFGLFVHGLDPTVAGDSELQRGQFNARVRLMRDEGSMPEITIGGIAGFGDDPLVSHSLYVAASKGFELGSGDFMRSIRFHAGFRQSWPELKDDVSTAFFGLELEVFRNLFMIGEVNTRDDDQAKTAWSAGFQYRSNAFGMSFAVLQDANESDETLYVGIGVSY
ncbi:MAG: hypothetical protein ACRCS9_13385 [Hyphomicrobium sp.]